VTQQDAEGHPDNHQLAEHFDRKFKFAHFMALSVKLMRDSTGYKDYADEIILNSMLKSSREHRLEDSEEALQLLLTGSLPADGIVGNLGYICYFSDHTPIKVPYIVGASFRAQAWFSAMKGKVFAVPEVAKMGAGEAIPFPAKNGRRKNDSEYLLLNKLGNLFAAYQIAKPSGEVFLFTDRIPCYSCRHVIELFLQKYDQIKLTVAYGLETASHHRNDELAMLNILGTANRLMRFDSGSKSGGVANGNFSWEQVV